MKQEQKDEIRKILLARHGEAQLAKHCGAQLTLDPDAAMTLIAMAMTGLDFVDEAEARARQQGEGQNDGDNQRSQPELTSSRVCG